MHFPKLILPLLLLANFVFSQNAVERIEPPSWWVGMKNPRVQLLVHGEKIGNSLPYIDHPGVLIEQVRRTPKVNYQFIDLLIEEGTKPGSFEILFFEGKQKTGSYTYRLQARETGSAQRQGFGNEDVLYLITPDRFANGDPSNDSVEGLRERANRSEKGGRHGGDIAGIRQNLDYLDDMGFTAIWLNPVLENDMEKYSYHGYSTTDFYKVDPRFGSNEEYRQLAQEARAKGIGLIMDMIVNHCGSFHWWMNDPPTPDWINTWENYTETNHRKSALQDPHAAESTRRQFTDGWFVPTMPDLNQRNELMANYLIQNAIWWTEYLGLTGIRMDTYPYSDQDFMAEWSRRLMAEYPNFNIVGEEWTTDPNIVAYWQRGKVNPNGYVSHLPSVMDFPLQINMAEALHSEENWAGGLINLYEIMAKDYLYPNPDALVVFPDNHDMPRILAQLGGDEELFRMANAYVLTTRGIPQLYYGTEVLMTSPVYRDDGLIRSDFPGGWTGDAASAFSGEGLTAQQKSMQEYLRKLLKWRKTATAIHHGKLIHFVPTSGVYVYFRSDERQKIMVILNKNDAQTELILSRYAEMLEGVTRGTDVLTGQEFEMGKTLRLPGRGAFILELR